MWSLVCFTPWTERSCEIWHRRSSPWGLGCSNLDTGRFLLIFFPLLAVMISSLFYVIVQEHNNN
jgi:hypothetical protein